MEMQYTSAEVRMMEARRQCEKGSHAPTPELIAASWMFPVRANAAPLYPDSRTFECSKCDAVVTIKYPPLGRTADAP